MRAAAGAALLALLPSAAAAGDGAAFLKAAAGARAAGMGFSGAAAVEEAGAAGNPGALAFLEHGELSAGRTLLPAEARLDALSWTGPSRRGGWSAEALYLSRPALEARGEDGSAAGSFSAWDGSAAVGAGMRWGTSLGMGIAGRWVEERWTGGGARGISADAGLLYRIPGKGLAFGAVARHLGPPLKAPGEAPRLPSTFSAGAAWRAGPATLVVDAARRLRGGRAEAGLGLEWAPAPALSLRAGHSRPLSKGDGFSARSSGWSGGLGLRVGRYRVDYALTPSEELGPIQRIQLTWRPGADR